VDVLKHPGRGEIKWFLSEHGANFKEIKEKENKESLQKWTNQGNADAMKAIWGEERWEHFKNWAKNYARQYESTTYVKQGRLKKSGQIGSGFVRLLCLMTRYAAFSDETDPEFKNNRFVTEVRTRLANGELRDEGVDPRDFRTLKRPDTGEEYRPGSFPPGYIDALVFEMESWEK